MRLISHTFSGFGELVFLFNEFTHDDSEVSVTLLFRDDPYKDNEKDWNTLWSALCAAFDEVTYVSMPGIKNDCFSVKRSISGNARDPKKLLIRWLDHAQMHYMRAFWDDPLHKGICWKCNTKLPDGHNLIEGCPHCGAFLICA